MDISARAVADVTSFLGTESVGIGITHTFLSLTLWRSVFENLPWAYPSSSLVSALISTSFQRILSTGYLPFLGLCNVSRMFHSSSKSSRLDRVRATVFLARRRIWGLRGMYLTFYCTLDYSRALGLFALVPLSVAEGLCGCVICQSFKGFKGVFGSTGREWKWRVDMLEETHGGERDVEVASSSLRSDVF